MPKTKSKKPQTMSSKTLLMILTSFLAGMLTVIAIYQLKYSAIKSEQAQLLVPTSVPEIQFSLDDVAMHSTKDDCWQVIDGVVYDFTEYISSGEHPGGGAMIKDCGTDASEVYKTRPPHSEYATSLLPEYRIGILEKESMQQ